MQDDVAVIKNDSNLGSFSSLATSWTEPYYKNNPSSGAYRPLTSFSFSLNTLVLGKGAWGYRLVNVLLYSILCWLVFKFLKTIYIDSRLRENDNLAFVVALIFTVHPIHTEVVNNIVGRAEILSLIFLLLMVFSVQKKKWEMGIFMFMLALFSKESAIVGVVIFVVLMWIKKIKIEERVGVFLYLVFSLVGYFALRFMVLGEFIFSNNASMVENPFKFMNFGQRILGALTTLSLGVEKLLFPLNLSYDYSFNQISVPNSVFDVRVLMGLGIVIISGIYLYRFLPSKTGTGRLGMTNKFGLLMGEMLFWLPLLVIGNFVLITGTIFGERLWFIPSLGLLMVVGVLINNLWIPSQTRNDRGNMLWLGMQKKMNNLLIPAFAGMTALIILFGLRTVVRNFDWMSEKSLFLHDAKYSTNSVLASSNEAAIYLSDRDFEKAKIALDRAELIYPKYPMLMNNWGIYYWWSGDKPTAKEKFEKCLLEYPENGLCKSNLDALSLETMK